MKSESPIISYTNQPSNQVPWFKRINLRMIVFLSFISLPFILVAVVFVRGALNHGVEHGKDCEIVDLKALGNFPFDPRNSTEAAIPPTYRNLDGKRVQLQGFMWAGKEASSRVQRFQFVYNIAKCCFNGPPQVQERVFIEMPRGKMMPFTDEFMELTGILHVKVERDGGTATSVYTLDVEKAKPVG